MPLDDRDKVAHLLRRAGFAARPEQIEAAVNQGLEATVQAVLDFRNIPDNLPELPPAPNGASYLSFTFGDFLSLGYAGPFIEDLERWWLNAMISTTRPLQEKMVLFWHGLFATSGADLDFRQMYLQNENFRGNFNPDTGELLRPNPGSPFPVGDFRIILESLTKDPAMLFWLDNWLNVRLNNEVGTNENYARELLELFSLGVEDVVTRVPNYTERDVRQASRALTGWSVYFGTRNNPEPLIRRFFFNSGGHDQGPYDVLGVNFRGDGRQLFDIIVQHRNAGQVQSACGRFIGYRLFKFFGYDDPEPEVVNYLADVFDGRHGESPYVIQNLLAAIFTPGNPASEAFYSEHAFKAHVKSPTEYLVSAYRFLKPDGLGNIQVARLIINPMIQMGQYLFFPPDVSGWDEGLNWINTSFSLARFNFANTFAAILRNSREGAVDVDAILIQNGLALDGGNGRANVTASPEQIVDFFTQLMLPAAVSPQSRQTLVDYLNAPGGSSDFVNTKVRGLMHVIMTMPDFQLS